MPRKPGSINEHEFSLIKEMTSKKVGRDTIAIVVGRSLNTVSRVSVANDYDEYLENAKERKSKEMYSIEAKQAEGEMALNVEYHTPSLVYYPENRETWTVNNISEQIIQTIKTYGKANKLTISGSLEKLVARGMEQNI